MAVIYEAVDTLRAAGVDAFILTDRPDGRYLNTSVRPPILHSPAMDYVRLRHAGLRAKAMLAKKMAFGSRSGDASPYDPRPGDVLVSPEYLLGVVLEAYPSLPVVIFSQNSFSYLSAYSKAVKRGLSVSKRVVHTIGINDSCMDAIEVLSSGPASRVPVGPNFELFHYQERKKPQICYMPRKRPQESEIVVDALTRRGSIAGYDIIRLELMGQAQVAAHMADSLFFLSFMEQEALGFPGIEAMSSGCVVIGYTGFGTREYFTPETGVPIEEGDTAGFVFAVERCVAEYAADPSRLNAVRGRANDVVRERYGRERSRAALIEAFRQIEASAEIA